jgi:hypothetical protein
VPVLPDYCRQPSPRPGRRRHVWRFRRHHAGNSPRIARTVDAWWFLGARPTWTRVDGRGDWAAGRQERRGRPAAHRPRRRRRQGQGTAGMPAWRPARGKMSKQDAAPIHLLLHVIAGLLREAVRVVHLLGRPPTSGKCGLPPGGATDRGRAANSARVAHCTHARGIDRPEDGQFRNRISACGIDRCHDGQFREHAGCGRRVRKSRQRTTAAQGRLQRTPSPSSPRPGFSSEDGEPSDGFRPQSPFVEHGSRRGRQPLGELGRRGVETSAVVRNRLAGQAVPAVLVGP